MTTTHDRDTASQPTPELPPFVFVPDDHTVARSTGEPDRDPAAVPPPSVEEASRPRRWGAGHTVAAAVVAVGVLVSGGAALAARDAATGTDDVPGAPAGVVPGLGQQNQQAPQGQLPAGQLPGQVPGQLGGPFGDDGTDDGHDDDGGTFPGGQLPGSTTGGTGSGTTGQSTGGVTT